MSKSNSIEPKKRRRLSWIIEIFIVLAILVLTSSSSGLLGKIVERDQREQLLLLPLFLVLLLAIPAVGFGTYLFLVRRRVQSIEKTEADAAAHQNKPIRIYPHTVSAGRFYGGYAYKYDDYYGGCRSDPWGRGFSRGRHDSCLRAHHCRDSGGDDMEYGCAVRTSGVDA